MPTHRILPARRSRRPHRTVLAALFVMALTAVALGRAVVPAVAATAVVRGEVFADSDRDGSRDAGEQGWGGTVLYLMSADRSTYLGQTTTDSAGAYRFDGVADGDYSVEFRPSDWWEVRQDWVPTTVDGLVPRVPVTVTGDAVVDFGWREIVRSSTPLSSVTGPSGVQVHSYNDVVTATEVHDLLAAGELVGDEAGTVTIHHDRGTAGTSCTGSWVEVGGTYSNYSATCNLAWSSWLSGADRSLFHEYGHAWSLYYASVVQQDTSFADYLEVRGLLGDARLDTSHAWSRRELIAEDYRQLFGTPLARGVSQENRDIPPASEVPGLAEYLSGAFMTSTSDPSGSEPSPDEDLAVDLVSPTDGQTVTDTVTVDVAADGEPVAVTVRIGDGDAVEASWEADRGLFVATLSLKGMKGSQDVVATATDASGARAFDAVTVDVAKGRGGGENTGGGNGGRNGKGPHAG